MTNKITKENLLKRFGAIREFEEGARLLYDEYLEKIKDINVRKTILVIRDDEIKHIEIAERLLAIVKKEIRLQVAEQ